MKVYSSCPVEEHMGATTPLYVDFGAYKLNEKLANEKGLKYGFSKKRMNALLEYVPGWRTWAEELAEVYGTSPPKSSPLPSSSLAS
jgi:hypothetical protein